MDEERALKKFSFGSCSFDRMSPPVDKIISNTKILNLKVSLEEALKLNLAIDECIRKIYRYKGSTEIGKRAMVNIAIHLQAERITINKDKMPRNMEKKTIHC